MRTRRPLAGKRQQALGLRNGMAGLMRPGVSMATRSSVGASTIAVSRSSAAAPGFCCASRLAPLLGQLLLVGAERRCARATSLSSLEIRSLRSRRSWKYRPRPLRTLSSSCLPRQPKTGAWSPAGEAMRVRASFSRVVSALSLSPSGRIPVITRTRSLRLVGQRQSLASQLRKVPRPAAWRCAPSASASSAPSHHHRRRVAAHALHGG